jgi:hypothetical protein
MVRGRVTHRIEKASATACVAPPFGVDALGISAHVKKIGPCLIVEFRGLCGSREMCLAAVREFDFRPFPAEGADDEQHREASQ